MGAASEAAEIMSLIIKFNPFSRRASLRDKGLWMSAQKCQFNPFSRCVSLRDKGCLQVGVLACFSMERRDDTSLSCLSGTVCSFSSSSIRCSGGDKYPSAVNQITPFNPHWGHINPNDPHMLPVTSHILLFEGHINVDLSAQQALLLQPVSL